ncbi:MAG TPA: c-type cytochrome [Gemmatimonadota bacterium]|nr:c-type cytochrome [Gemmatimonadota bacterium]
MWRTNLTVALLVVGTLAVYTAVANMIPQVESAVPEELDLGADVTPEELVAAGEQVYGGAGGCTACHGLGTRAPDLLGVVGSVCAERVTDMSCKDYLHESLIDPAAYVVDGFQPIMPDMSRTLSSDEIWSLVAFLEAQGGEVTVTGADLETGDDAADGAAGPVVAPTAAGTATGAAAGETDPETLMQTLGCVACHAAEEGAGGVGPLVPAMADLERDYVRRSILDPAADTAPGFEAMAGTMPTTFGDQLTAAQLEALVDYLAGGD